MLVTPAMCSTLKSNPHRHARSLSARRRCMTLELLEPHFATACTTGMQSQRKITFFPRQ